MDETELENLENKFLTKKEVDVDSELNSGLNFSLDSNLNSCKPISDEQAEHTELPPENSTEDDKPTEIGNKT